MLFWYYLSLFIMLTGVTLHWLEMILFRESWTPFPDIWNVTGYHNKILVCGLQNSGFRILLIFLFLQYEHLMFLSLCLVYICWFLTLIQLLSATAITKQRLFKIHLISHLYATYVSLEYFYTSKPLSSNLFSVGAVRVVGKRSLTQRRDSCI